MLEIRNLYKEYTAENIKTVALNDVSLVIKNTGLISVVGPSGCGKTTLLNVIGGLDNKYIGEILIDDINVLSNNKYMKRRKNLTGFVFQEYNLIETLNVYDNIKIALNKAKEKNIKARIYSLLEKLKLKDKAKKYPKELSGGEKQRVAIARALINDPSVILADEPTGALDSNNSLEIIKILKEISQNRLVIMVTHNEVLAKRFSDEIIEMVDGKIINRLNISNEKPKLNIKKSIEKKSVLNLFKLSVQNLKRTIIRSLLSVLACAIGIMSLCLVVNVANGMNLYIDNVQKQALKTYPVTINSDVVDDEIEQDDIDYIEYPNTNLIYITDNDPSYYGHVNTFTNEFMSHIKNMDNSFYTVINYSGWVNMNILCKNSNNGTSYYNWIRSYYYFKEANFEKEYLSSEYDLLTGAMPTDKYEMALVIDKNNCISKNVLSYLGIDSFDFETLTFEDIIGKEFKWISNDIYYNESGNGFKDFSYFGKTKEDIYCESTISLKITGVLRQKPSAKTKLYGTSLLYSSSFADYVLEQNINSKIGKRQLQYKNIDAYTGEEFEDIVTGSYIETAKYQYESNLDDFGCNYYINRIQIYTDKFEKFEYIHNYIEEYNDSNIDVSKIKYTDYLKEMTAEFDLFMDILTKVLLVFTLIALIVAGIMIVIITYVSVIEKTRQIGILKSLGYVNTHIASVFIIENGIIGLFSGLFGVIGGVVFINPILNAIIDVMNNSQATAFDVNSLRINDFNILYLCLIVISSIIITIISGLIPSIIGAKKDPVKAISR